MISKGKTDQVTINLDGKEVEVPAGMNLVDAVAFTQRDSSLLLSSATQRGRQLPDVPYRNGDADEGPEYGELLKRTVRLKLVGFPSLSSVVEQAFLRVCVRPSPRW